MAFSVFRAWGFAWPGLSESAVTSSCPKGGGTEFQGTRDDHRMPTLNPQPFDSTCRGATDAQRDDRVRPTKTLTGFAGLGPPQRRMQ
ncbi:hypothetical protein SKAU_G00406970 [Synaphobranchus kaupii]|uniref:Secreted protein n=1 Tax=Synaphobranchus kaupii TaxID=118154 RepID=A0A9Q1EA56_SYNKA|nr:hypothetical protein SKAU_G00406970 [Synaphobranchus kaupii]